MKKIRQMGLPGALFILAVVPVRAGVTSAFNDSVPGQALVFESDFGSADGWTLNRCQIDGGALSSTTSTAWASADIDVQLELSGQLTVLYWSGQYDGGVWSDQIHASLHTAADGTYPRAGGGLKARGASASLWERGWLGTTEVGNGGAGSFSEILTNDLPQVSTSDFLQYRMVYDGSVVDELQLRFEQFVEFRWDMVSAHTVSNFTDSSQMGGSLMDSLRFYFRTTGEQVGDVAVTQGEPGMLAEFLFEPGEDISPDFTNSGEGIEIVSGESYTLTPDPFFIGGTNDFTIEVPVKPSRADLCTFFSIPGVVTCGIAPDAHSMEVWCYPRPDDRYGDISQRHAFNDIPLSRTEFQGIALTYDGSEQNLTLWHNGIPYGELNIAIPETEVSKINLAGSRWMVSPVAGTIGSFSVSSAVLSFTANPPSAPDASELSALQARSAVCAASLSLYSGPVIPRSTQLGGLLTEIDAAIAAGNILRADRLLVMAEWNAAALDSGQAQYRAELRETVRSQSAASNVILRVTWEPWTPQEAQNGIDAAEYLGATELGVHGPDRFPPASLQDWKSAGYETFMLTAPLMDRNIADEVAIQGWGTAVAQAAGSTTQIQLSSTREILPEDMRVQDRTTSQTLPGTRWNYDAGAQTISVSDTVAGNQYQAFFRILEDGLYNPLNPDALALALTNFVEEMTPYMGVLDTLWIEPPGFVPLGSTSLGFDWNSFSLTAGPDNEAQFAADTGVAFDPEWLAGWQSGETLFLDAAPSDETLVWMNWLRAKALPSFQQVAAACHDDLGMTLWQHWGDGQVSTEPCLGTLSQIGAAQMDTALRNSAVEARSLADVPGGITKLFRVAWDTFEKTETMPASDPALSNWTVSKRGLLPNMPEGLYWAPFYYAAQGVESNTADFYVERAAEISDEFTLLASQIGGHRFFTHPVKVAVVTAWGQAYAWHPWWNSDVLLHLTDLPVEVNFFSFDEVSAGGVPAGTDVVFLFGLPDTSWSGGRFWQDGSLVSAVTTYVASGGGLLAFQAASYEPDSGALALGNVLGVELTDPVALSGTFAECDGTNTIADIANGMTVFSRPGATVLYDLGAVPGVVSNSYGQGRSIYINGSGTDYGLSRLVKELLFKAAGREELLDALDVSGAESAFVYLYSEVRKLAVLNETVNAATASLRCDPSLMGMAGLDVTLTDAATGEMVYDGPAAALADGIEISLPPDCVKLISCSAHTARGVALDWLNAHGCSNEYATAELSDLDGDGLLLWQEYYAGTDPNDASSRFYAEWSNGQLVWYAGIESGVDFFSMFIAQRICCLDGC